MHQQPRNEETPLTHSTGGTNNVTAPMTMAFHLICHFLQVRWHRYALPILKVMGFA